MLIPRKYVLLSYLGVSKYSSLRLPMGICGSPDFFQERMTGLMESVEYIRCYIDGLLIITRESYEDHLKKLREVLAPL